MKRNRYCIANWKMNGSKDLIKDWITSVSENIKIQDEKECVFCPPVGYLNLSIELIKEKELGIKLGSQLIESNLSQPLTGGVSPEMLVDLGCEYAIIGHSEQRTYYNENDSQLINKIEAAIEENIKPIYCIGENSEQKNSEARVTKLKILDRLCVWFAHFLAEWLESLPRELSEQIQSGLNRYATKEGRETAEFSAARRKLWAAMGEKLDFGSTMRTDQDTVPTEYCAAMCLEPVGVGDWSKIYYVHLIPNFI